MFELLALAGLILGLVVLGLVLKVTFSVVIALLVLPFQILGWVIGGLFKLILLPFQILGALILGLILLPLLLIGLPVLLGLGVPILVLGALLLAGWAVLAVVCALGSAKFGWC